MEKNETNIKNKKRKYTIRQSHPRDIKNKLKNWFIDHIDKPFPTEYEKNQLINQTGLKNSQITN